MSKFSIRGSIWSKLLFGKSFKENLLKHRVGKHAVYIGGHIRLLHAGEALQLLESLVFFFKNLRVDGLVYQLFLETFDDSAEFLN